MNIRYLRNIIRINVLRKKPLCPECDEEMVRRGFPRDFNQSYKCMNCGYGAPKTEGEL